MYRKTQIKGRRQLWTQAYRKEDGNDVLVSTDQISEWEASCKEGKKPN